MAQGIQYAHAKRHQADEEDIGKHETVEINRQRILVGNPGKARGHDGDDERRKEDARHGDDHKDDGEGGESDVGQLQCFLPGLFVQIFRKDGDKGNRQRSFPQKPSQHVGNSKRDEKGVGGQSRAEKGRHDHIPEKSEYAAQHGRHTDDTGGLGDFRILGVRSFVLIHNGMIGRRS